MTPAADIAADAVAGQASALDPVPGGVRAVTTVLLLRHTTQSTRGPQRAGFRGQPCTLPQTR